MDVWLKMQRPNRNYYHRFLSLSIQTLFGNLIYWFNISDSFIHNITIFFPSSPLWISFVRFYSNFFSIIRVLWTKLILSNWKEWKKWKGKGIESMWFYYISMNCFFCGFVDFFSFVPISHRDNEDPSCELIQYSGY